MSTLPTFSPPAVPGLGLRLQRDAYLALLNAALGAHAYRFSAEVALHWLAVYPGDLQVSLLYAQALTGDGRDSQAKPVLEAICSADPEYPEAARALVWLQTRLGIERELGALYALQGRLPAGDEPPEWGEAVWQARQAVQMGDGVRAAQLILPALAANPPHPLSAITHLAVLAVQEGTPLEARLSLAAFYHERWPDSLACALHLADAWMAAGEMDQAVSLLHAAAGRDITGQVARRLWGQNHPYRPLWPEALEREIDFSLPAPVASALGWNVLPEPAQKLKEPEPTLSTLSPASQSKGGNGKNGTAPRERVKSEPAQTKPTDTPVYVVLSLHQGLVRRFGPDGAEAVEQEMELLTGEFDSRSGWESARLLADLPADALPLDLKPVRPNDAWAIKLSLTQLQENLARHGKRIGALLIVGGPEIVPFHHLPNPVDDQDADVPSDNPYATCDENYFITEWPVGRLPDGAGPDPSFLIARLRQVRADRHKPRPSAKLGLAVLLERARAAAETAAQPVPNGREPSLLQRWLQKLRLWIAQRLNQIDSPQMATGFTAAVWRQAARAVFRPVGEPGALLVSPPYDANQPFALPPAPLGYFNLHGLADAPEWYGQRDPLEVTTDPAPVDYPVALSPENLRNAGKNGSARRRWNVPQVVFSEACYGAHILGKAPHESMALSFLQAGCQAFIGSTVVSYGSLSEPLAAADLLGHAFWSALHSGTAAGEALRQARIELTRQMHSRQGFLDGEDQKTLISFVLYGDPMASPLELPAAHGAARWTAHCPDSNGNGVKGLLSFHPRLKRVPTVCDRSNPVQETAPPPEVLAAVKQIVAKHLPGMAGAHLLYSQERSACANTPACCGDSLCPTRRLKPKTRSGAALPRQLVTLSKQVDFDGHLHPQYARLTLDSQGKLVKLVISR